MANMFFDLLGRKCSFFKHSTWSTILEDSRWTTILSLIISKLLENFLFIVENHMYIMNFVAQLERNFFNLGHKITSWNLVGPSPIVTSIPFKSKIKWNSFTSIHLEIFLATKMLSQFHAIFVQNVDHM